MSLQLSPELSIYPAENDMAILFALLSAFIIGLNTIVIKKILSKATPFYTATILTLVGMVFFWVLAFIALPRGLILSNIKANIFFVLAGFFAPGLVRWLFFTSMALPFLRTLSRECDSRSSPIRSSPPGGSHTQCHIS